MYEITVEDHIDAAHYLRNYGGKCENLHGHRFRVAVTVRSRKLDENGLAYDFRELKERMKKVLNAFDHTCLNEHELFSKINPSSENIARTLFDLLKPELMPKTEIAKIEVWESPECRASYLPD